MMLADHWLALAFENPANVFVYRAISVD